MSVVFVVGRKFGLLCSFNSQFGEIFRRRFRALLGDVSVLALLCGAC